MAAEQHPVRVHQLHRPAFDASTVPPDGSIAAPSAPPQSAERYSLGKEIARGGMGTVYRATDTVLEREVAVKVLQEWFGPESGAARRFRDEARITGQLQHPGIPAVHDLGHFPDGRPFIAMKLVKGETLGDLLAGRSGPARERGRFVAVFEQICQAVAYAHARRVIHRDLKPANVMVGAFAEVQVMDWGLAKVLGVGAATTEGDPGETAAASVIHTARDSDGSETQAGSVLGTPAFMPPEQAVGAVGQIDARSDVFGLGGSAGPRRRALPPLPRERAARPREVTGGAGGTPRSEPAVADRRGDLVRPGPRPREVGGQAGGRRGVAGGGQARLAVRPRAHPSGDGRDRVPLAVLLELLLFLLVQFDGLPAKVEPRTAPILPPPRHRVVPYSRCPAESAHPRPADRSLPPRDEW